MLSIAQQQHPSMVAAAAQQRNLVVAVDHTEGSYKALKWTLEHLYRDGDVLHLLHVVPAASSVTCCGGFDLASTLPPEEGLQESMAAHAIEYFAQYMQLARKHGADCELDLVHGACNQTVSKDICRKVEELSAAVVVLSEQKQGFIESIFMQTPVTQHVVQNCSRPTLVLNHNA